MTTNQRLLEASKRDLKAVQEILLEGPDVNVVDSGGMSPLYWACFNQLSSIAKELLEHGADPNIANIHGLTPLYWACFNGTTDIIKMLLSKGANPNTKTEKGETSLSIAIKKWHFPAAKILLCQEDIEVTDNDVEHILHLAVRNGDIKLVRQLLINGADRYINTIYQYGRTLLYEACRNGSITMVKLLLTINGIDPNIANTYGETPLHRAVKSGHLEIIAELLTIANPNIVDNEGQTPLFWASINKCTKIVELFASTGGVVDPNIMDIIGHTPLYWAYCRGNLDVIRVLLSIGADPNLTHSIKPEITEELDYFPSFQILAIRCVRKYRVNVSKIPPVLLRVF